MYTYQDLLKVADDKKKKMEFTRSVINDYQGSELYKNAVLAKEYDRRRNRTITQYRKFLQTVSGKVVPDNYSANYKLCSNFFDFFVLQENQYLLGNGVTWQNRATAGKLGYDFDTDMQTLGKKALVEGVAFGFWNLDHLECFGASEFAPLYDEESGALMAGVRFWQLDPLKPLRATLFEMDGYTEYIWRDSGADIFQEKRPYVLHLRTSAIDGTEIYDGENYPSFPIVPLWGSLKKQSEIVGLQESIDAYDLIKSGFANDLDDCTQIYWILKNAGGMGEDDLQAFINQLKRTRSAVLMDGVEADPHTIDIPYAARETLLTRLRDDLFEHAMAFDPKKLASGGSVVTAAIRAAYMPLDEKTDEYEYCIRDFLKSLLAIIGVEDENPTFTRSMVINEQEQIQTLVSASSYLPKDYITEKVLNILGDGGRAEEIINQMNAEEMERMQYAQTQFQKSDDDDDSDDDTSGSDDDNSDDADDTDSGSSSDSEDNDSGAGEDDDSKKKKKRAGNE